MDEKINQKVINIFKNAQKKDTPHNNSHPVKFYAGVSYVRLDEDVNGYPFNKNNLIENAEKFAYIVRVIRHRNGKPSLYNYNVPYEKIISFISMFANGELSGTIIDIDKYKPNDLA